MEQACQKIIFCMCTLRDNISSVIGVKSTVQPQQKKYRLSSVKNHLPLRTRHFLFFYSQSYQTEPRSPVSLQYLGLSFPQTCREVFCRYLDRQHLRCLSTGHGFSGLKTSIPLPTSLHAFQSSWVHARNGRPTCRPCKPFKTRGYYCCC